MPQFSPQFFLVIITWGFLILSLMITLNQTVNLPMILRVNLARITYLFTFKIV